MDRATLKSTLAPLIHQDVYSLIPIPTLGMPCACSPGPLELLSQVLPSLPNNLAHMETELLTFQLFTTSRRKFSCFLAHLSIFLVCVIYLTDLVQFFVLAITSWGMKAEIAPKVHAAVNQENTDKKMKIETKRNVTVKHKIWAENVFFLNDLLGWQWSLIPPKSNLGLIGYPAASPKRATGLSLSHMWQDWTVLSRKGQNV